MGFYQILAVICLITALTLLIWTVNSFFSRRSVGGRKTAISVEITAEGSAGELEQSVKGLIWLMKTGSLSPLTEIFIANADTNDETAEMARILEREFPSVTIK